MRYFLFVLLLLGYNRPLIAQTVSLDLPYFDDYLRDQQLLGNVDGRISWMLKPLHIQKTLQGKDVFASDSSWWLGDTKSDFGRSQLANSKGVELLLLPFHHRTQYNALHNYGWQNGPMVSSRGLQYYFSGGFNFQYKQKLEVQLRPEYVYAVNRPQANPPVRHGGIDNPEKMGLAPFQEWYAGQSYIKWHWKALSMGLSTENVQWGPARQGSLFLSPSAPGFLHMSIHTNRPVKTPIGHFEAQFIGGRLRYSGFYPYGIDWIVPTEPPFEPFRTPDITPSPLGTREHSKLSAITTTFQPKGLKGLYVGGAFGVQSVNYSPWRGLLAVFMPGTERANNANFSSQNALITLFGRYLIPEAGFEIYGELGRDDWWFDGQDLAVDPFHTTVGILGMAKVKSLGKRDHYLRFSTEFTKLMGPMTQISRSPGNSFYTHSNQIGWTHRGQILGVGLPPGSNRQQIGLLWNKGYNRVGFNFERIEYAQDLFYFRMPFLFNPAIGNSLAMDYTKRFVDLVSTVRLQSAYRGLIFGVDVMYLQIFNYQWVYVPNATPNGFRFPGYNYRSVNAHAYLYYRI
jgi:hypothetical protein